MHEASIITPVRNDNPESQRFAAVNIRLKKSFIRVTKIVIKDERAKR